MEIPHERTQLSTSGQAFAACTTDRARACLARLDAAALAAHGCLNEVRGNLPRGGIFAGGADGNPADFGVVYVRGSFAFGLVEDESD